MTQGRVSQVFHGDGNMKIAAVARYLRGLGIRDQHFCHPGSSRQAGAARPSTRTLARASNKL